MQCACGACLVSLARLFTSPGEEGKISGYHSSMECKLHIAVASRENKENKALVSNVCG